MWQKFKVKTWFIENALPTEKVEAVVTDEKRQYGLAIAQKVATKRVVSVLNRNAVIMNVVVDAKGSISL